MTCKHDNSPSLVFPCLYQDLHTRSFKISMVLISISILTSCNMMTTTDHHGLGSFSNMPFFCPCFSVFRLVCALFTFFELSYCFPSENTAGCVAGSSHYWWLHKLASPLRLLLVGIAYLSLGTVLMTAVAQVNQPSPTPVFRNNSVPSGPIRGVTDVKNQDCNFFCGIEAPGGVRLIYWEPDDGITPRNSTLEVSDGFTLYVRAVSSFPLI